MVHQLPQGAELSDISAHYNQFTVPRELRAAAPLPGHRWGRIVVELGTLKIHLDGTGEPKIVTPGAPGVIPPDTHFRVDSGEEPLRFYFEYYHSPSLQDGSELARLLA